MHERVAEAVYTALEPLWAAVGLLDRFAERQPHVAAVLAVVLLSTKELIPDVFPALDAGLFNANPAMMGIALVLVVTAVLLVLSAVHHSIFSVTGFVASYLTAGIVVLAATLAIVATEPSVAETRPLWFEGLATVWYTCWLAAFFAGFQYLNLYGQRDDPEVPA